MIIDGVYQLDGTEKKEEGREVMAQGTMVTTTYRHAETGEVVRVDKNFEVSALTMGAVLRP